MITCISVRSFFCEILGLRRSNNCRPANSQALSGETDHAARLRQATQHGVGVQRGTGDKLVTLHTQNKWTFDKQVIAVRTHQR